jgi:hypothetical protein
MEEYEKNGKVYWTILPGDPDCDKKVNLWKKVLGTELVYEFLQPDPGADSEKIDL